MPTRGRSQFVRRAIDLFLAQTYIESELIILEDPAGSFPFDASSMSRLREEKGLALSRIQFSRTLARLTLGAKRNLCCAMASGEYVIHFDDDDWSDPERIAYQVKHIREAGSEVCGYHSLHFCLSGPTPRGFFHGRGLPFGASLIYRRQWWKSHPFPDVADGEDSGFSLNARKAGALSTVPDDEMLVAIQHGENTYKLDLGSGPWAPLYPEVPFENMPAKFVDWIRRC